MKTSTVKVRNDGPDKTDGPAVIFADNDREWCGPIGKNARRGTSTVEVRNDGPAVIFDDSDREWCGPIGKNARRGTRPRC